MRVRFAGRHGAGQSGPPHGRCTKSPEMRVRSREVTDGIVSTAPECRGASSPRALDPLQKLEPNVKEGAARFMRSLGSLGRLGWAVIITFQPPVNRTDPPDILFCLLFRAGSPPEIRIK